MPYDYRIIVFIASIVDFVIIMIFENVVLPVATNFYNEWRYKISMENDLTI